MRLTLTQGFLVGKDPKRISKSLKKSAVASKRQKGTPYQSAMSMLNFYINQAGKKLTDQQKKFYKHKQNKNYGHCSKMINYSLT
ncbi:DUF3175 domain-containing protein [Candidatus Coxiella mudrowiae]|uniref:DUF3175 domain-containing protein n=1 Tax=Candidatus Coxiella mudrowiae TaxID=2054173 RepID=UPI001FD2904F|nr:DUF3175 domain-containing protein [Candidatus Coxiella mudrowiae]